ncbi:MAG: helix-turn-helix domain-containing protein [Planctomycetota bacterium]
MDIKPIKTETDYKTALRKIERLMEADLNTPDGDTLDVLTTLVEAYEEKYYPVEPPDPIEAILHEMESQGLSRRDLELYLGTRARVSEILNRKRPLSLEMIRKLHQGLGISAGILIRQYSLFTNGKSANNSMNRTPKSRAGYALR